MSDFYKVTQGQIRAIKENRRFRFDFQPSLKILFKIIGTAITFWCTDYVFKKCIIEGTLENTISLGAIFATFGSAIVAVASLSCNNCYIKFSDNILVLQNDLLKNEKWTRWTFIKRKSKKRLLDSGRLVWVLENAIIEFQLGSHALSVFLPTVKADFDDLPIFRHFLKLKRYGKQYETNLCNHATQEDANAYFMWDCIFDIYVQIVYYKLYNYLIWIGCNFICVSIIFSFLYIYF